MHHKIAKIVLMVLGAIVLGLGIALLLGLVVMCLWNWLLPTLFHFPTITLLQAWGLVILCKLLFGSQIHPHMKHHKHHDSKCHHEHIKAKFANWVHADDKPEE